MESLLQCGRGRGSETTVSPIHKLSVCMSTYGESIAHPVACGCSHLTQLEEEEAMAQEVLLERSLHNPTLRDRLPIVTHTLAHKKKVNALLYYVYTLCEYGYSQCFVDMEKFLFSDENISIDPVVSLTKSLPNAQYNTLCSIRRERYGPILKQKYPSYSLLLSLPGL